jgi:hypothetical protein
MTVKTTKTSVLGFDGSKVTAGEIRRLLESVSDDTPVLVQQTFSSGDYGGSYVYTKLSFTEEA